MFWNWIKPFTVPILNVPYISCQNNMYTSLKLITHIIQFSIFLPWQCITTSCKAPFSLTHIWFTNWYKVNLRWIFLHESQLCHKYFTSDCWVSYDLQDMINTSFCCWCNPLCRIHAFEASPRQIITNVSLLWIIIKFLHIWEGLNRLVEFLKKSAL